jgi:predicted metalloprotease
MIEALGAPVLGARGDVAVEVVKLCTPVIHNPILNKIRLRKKDKNPLKYNGLCAQGQTFDRESRHPIGRDGAAADSAG